MKILIVQPWFTAIGHPAQSLLNTARILGRRPDLGYLISDPQRGQFAAMAGDLERLGTVERFDSRGDSLRTGTLLSLPSVLRLVRRNPDLQQVLFLDAHLAVLAAGWAVAGIAARGLRFVAVLHLGGPEPYLSRPIAAHFVRQFLSAPGRRLFLRTEELAQAWRQAFPGLPAERIDTLPSLEIADAVGISLPVATQGVPRFGLIGQVRPGKSLEWLVPMFRNHSRIGILNVAGAFTNAKHRDSLPILDGYPHFDNRFLAENDMLAAAGAQDYLLALYENWDVRMEAATFYLAARVGRPVIAYDEGWAGRMLREFGCGIAFARQPRPGPEMFAHLPRPGSAEYLVLIDGIARFREAHTGSRAVTAFLSKLFKR
jgi:hypothetical protein